MRELSIEEKAKRFDESLGKARRYYDEYKTRDNILYVEDIEEIFPELKESEDERIRNLIYLSIEKGMGIPNDRDRKKALAWIEKQGEHARFIEAIQVDDKVTRNQDGVLVNLSQLNRVAKKVEQKSAWSEEDEKIYSRIYDLIHAAAFENCEVDDVGNELGEYAKMTSLLKSIKERVQPQPKQKWSEEDKCMLNNVIETLKPLSQTIHSGYSINSMIEWFKSLRPQNHWKPSDEMLEALYRVIPENVMEKSEDEMLLDKLYQGLKYGKVLSEK